jgi:hypothetical protein
MGCVWKAYGRADGSRAPASRNAGAREMRILGKMKHGSSGRGGARAAPDRRLREGGGAGGGGDRTGRGARCRHFGTAGLGPAAAPRREILA